MMRPILAVGLVAGLTSGLCAQEGATGTVDLGTRPGPFLALSVANLDRMVAWYRDTLGFRIYNRGEAREGAVHFALLERENSILELLQLADARPFKEVAPGLEGSHLVHGFFKSGFVVADLDRAYADVKRMGVKLEYDLGRPTDSPYRSFGILDPEGNLLQFFGR